MFKKNLMVVALFMLITGISYAKSGSQIPLSKSIGASFEGNSGNLNSQNGLNPLLDTWTVTGFTYSQNFDKARWLTLTACIAVCGSYCGLPNGPGGSGITNFLGQNSQSNFSGYGELFLALGNNVTFGFNSVGRIDVITTYNVTFKDIHTLLTGSCMRLFPLGYAIYELPENLGPLLASQDGTDSRYLGFFDFNVGYCVQFSKQWDFSTNLFFRFNGSGINNQVAGSFGAFLDTFNIRWENQFTFTSSVTGFSAALQLRYAASNFYTVVRNQVSFLVNLAYSFDIAQSQS